VNMSDLNPVSYFIRISFANVFNKEVSKNGNDRDNKGNLGNA